MLYSCSSNNHWTEFYADGIPESGESYNDLIFTNDSVGYIAGSRMTNLGKNQFLFKTILYKTTDQGRSWKQIPIDYQGGIEKIFSFQDTLVVLIQYLSSEKRYILQSIDEGKNWEELFSYSSKERVRAICFDSANSGKIIFDKGDQRYLLRYQSSKWDTILTLPQNSYGDHLYKNQVISFQPEGNTANANGILITEITSKNTKEIHFDKPYSISGITQTNDALFIGVDEENSGKIIKYSKNQIQYLSFGKYSNYMPDQVFAFGNKILAIAHQEKNVTFLGIRHSLLISEDNGETWALERLPSSLSPEPAFLYQNRFFISHGLGEFQLRTF